MYYEYGIRYKGEEELHRGPMTKAEAEAWVDEFEADCPPGNQIREKFLIVTRSVSDWREVH